MKDELSELFHERFQGHESPVDPGAWEVIQARLEVSAPAPGEDAVEKLFREHFQGHESPVDPATWAHISSQLGQGAAVAGTAGTALAPLGWAAAGLGLLALVGVAYLYSGRPSTPGELAHGTPVTSSTEMPAGDGGAETLPVLQTPTDAEQAPALVQEGGHVPIDAASLPREEKPAAMPGGPTPDEAIPAEGRDAPLEPLSAIEGPVLVERIIERVIEQARVEEPLDVSMQDAPESSDEHDASSPAETPATAQPPALYLPNTFTPNGDGVNDTYVVMNPEAFERIITRVYAVSNNQLVFSSDNNAPWTGENQPDGYYLVAVEAVTPDGRLVAEGKVVWLNRNTTH